MPDTLTWGTQSDWEASTRDDIVVDGSVIRLADILPTAGLQHRYRASDITAADGDDVTVWPDTAGTVDLIDGDREPPDYATNVANGQPAVDFNDDTEQEGLQTPNAEWSALWQDQDYSIVFVAEPRDYQPTGDPRSYLNDNRDGSQKAHSMGDNSSAGDLAYKDSNNWHDLNVGQLTLDEPNVALWARDASTATMHGYLNGGSGSRSISVDDYSGDPNGIGHRPTDNDADHFDGFICEILVYGRALSSAEQADIGTYAAAVYGVTL